MPGQVVGGPVTMEGSIDPEGYRTYTVVFQVKLDSYTEGPAAALQAFGLPLPGSMWLIGDDIDVWVWFRPEATASIKDEKRGDKNVWYDVEMTASNRPRDSKKCHEQRIEDPLMEPQIVSGGAVLSKEEITFDRDGFRVTNVMDEQTRGPQVEFDQVRGQIKIEQNVAVLDDNRIIDLMQNAPLNDAELWGHPARCVRLSEFTWQKLYHGQCYTYYKRMLTFEVWVRRVYDNTTGTGNEYTLVSGWDREILGEGSKTLLGYWDTEEGSPTFDKYIVDETVNVNAVEWSDKHKTKFKDKHGELARIIYSEDFPGLPISTDILYFDSGSNSYIGATTSDEPYKQTVERWDESDLIAELGIPASY